VLKSHSSASRITSLTRSRISWASREVVSACAARKSAPAMAASSSRRRLESLSDSAPAASSAFFCASCRA